MIIDNLIYNEIKPLAFTESQTIIISNTLNADQINHFLDDVIDVEFEKEFNCEISFEKMETDTLISVFKHLMQLNVLEKISNPILILNILSLIKSYNTFNDDFFADNKIIINSIEQFLDIKIELQDEIKQISIEIATYFISLFRSISKTEYTILDSYVELPTFYKSVFVTTNLVSISSILAQIPDIYTFNLKFIKGAHLYVSSILTSYKMTSEIMNSFFEQINNGK